MHSPYEYQPVLNSFNFKLTLLNITCDKTDPR